MIQALSTRQRLVLAILLVATGQVLTAIGGAWCLGFGIAASVAAVATVLVNAALVRDFIVNFGAQMDRLAGGDLAAAIDGESPSPDIRRLKQSLLKLQLSMRQAVGTIRSGADGVTLASQEIAQGNADLSRRTEQTASNLQQAAASMAQLTTTVNQTADSARTANQLASSASEVAARGGSVVAQVVSTMDEINHSSKKIADIIGTIDGIAFQTNILALNAAVEAARAGEQGRGFAVVAGEVRALAQRSAEAAREIKGLIGTSVQKVESGSRLVQDAGNTMGEIVASVQRVTDIIGEISAAAAEQSSGIGQVNTSVTQLDAMTQQNAALVEESSAAAESLKEQSRQLAQAVAGFKLDGGAMAPATPSTPAPVAPAAAAPAAVPAKTPQAAKPKAASKPATPRALAGAVIRAAARKPVRAAVTPVPATPAPATPAPAAAAPEAPPPAPRKAAAPAAAAPVAAAAPATVAPPSDDWETF